MIPNGRCRFLQRRSFFLLVRASIGQMRRCARCYVEKLSRQVEQMSTFITVAIFLVPGVSSHSDRPKHKL